MKQSKNFLLSSVIAIIMLPASLYAQMQSTMTASSTVRTIVNDGLEPIKSLACSSTTVIALLQKGDTTYFQMTMDGTTTVSYAYLTGYISEDFTVLNDEIYFCGKLSSGSNAFFAKSSIANIFTGGSINITTSYGNYSFTKIDAYRDYTGLTNLTLISSANDIYRYTYSTSATSSIDVYYTNISAADSIHLFDITHTNEYVCVIGTSNLASHDNLIHLYKFRKDVQNAPINEYIFQLSSHIIFYETGVYKVKMTALNSDNNYILTGTHLTTYNSSDPKYEEFDLINLDDDVIENVQDVIFSSETRPELYDMEYDRYLDRVLCLSYIYDFKGVTYDQDVIFDINPYETQRYSTQLIIPNYLIADSTSTNKHFLKNLAVYAHGYYLAFGKNSQGRLYFFDKNDNITADRNCYTVDRLNVQIRKSELIPINHYDPNLLLLGSTTDFWGVFKRNYRIPCR